MTVSVAGIIDQQYANAQSYASQAITTLHGAISDAQSYFGAINPATISWALDPSITPPTTTNQYVNANYVAPTALGQFNPNSLQQLNPVDPMVVPTAPIVNIAGLFNETVPTNTAGDFTTAAPIINFDAINTALAAIQIPTIVTYQPPVLAPITINPIPTVTVPTFDASIQATDPGSLSGVQNQFYQQYENLRPEIKGFVDAGVNAWMNTYAPNYLIALGALEAKLQDGINRGTALGQDFEDALYARARSRVETDHNRAVLDLENQYKKRGFDIPPAALMAGRNMLQQNTANSLAIQATELSIERAKLEIQHIQFVLSTSTSLRQSMANNFLSYANVSVQINAQAIEFAKIFSDILMRTYELMVQHYLAQQGYYKVQAEVYETQLKASLATLEVYKLSLESVKLQVDVEHLQVINYKTQVEAELINIQMYTELLKNIEVRVAVAKSQIEVFAEQVAAYNAELNGQKIKTDIYIAQLQGDTAKLEAQKTLVEVFKTEVDANKLVVDSNIAIQDLRNTNNRTLLSVYEAEVSGYRAEIEAAVASFKGSVEAQIAGIEAYKTSLEVDVEVYRTQLELNKLTLEKAVDQAKLNWDAESKYVDATLASWSLVSNITKEVGSALAAMSAAALVSQNTNVSQATTA